MRRRGLAIAVAACAIPVIALLVLYRHRDTVWNRGIVLAQHPSLEDQRYDATLRADLGTANVLDLVIVSGPDWKTALRRRGACRHHVAILVKRGVIGDFDSPATYLPSLATQRARRDALPDRRTLQDHLRRAAADLPLQEDQLSPFLDDVQAARSAPLVTASDLRAHRWQRGFDALMLHQSGHWSALLPLHAPAGDGGAASDIDVARVGPRGGDNTFNAQVLDLKTQADALYATTCTRRCVIVGPASRSSHALDDRAARAACAWHAFWRRWALPSSPVAASLVLAWAAIDYSASGGNAARSSRWGSNYALFFDGKEWREHNANAASDIGYRWAIANLNYR